MCHCLAFLWVFGADTLPLGTDAYFHLAFASQLNLSNLAPDITALPFTLLGTEGPDHHWLIHWLQKPLIVFFGFSDPSSNLAFATIAWAALVPALLSSLLRSHHVPYAAIIATVGVWGLYLMPDRLLMFRAQNAAIVMTVALTILMTSRRYIAVALFFFLFNHAYQGVVLGALIGFCALLTHGLTYRQFDRSLIVASLVGLLLSLFSSPWFPDNIRYFVEVMLGRLLMPIDSVPLMGSEWLPLGPSTLLEVGLVGHVCLLLSLGIVLYKWRSILASVELKRALVFVLLSIIFLFLYARHWRMGEFYGPFSAIALGFSLSLISAHKRIVASMVLALSVVACGHQYFKKPNIQPNERKYSAQCQYLNQNAQPGALVFNLPWDAFSHLYGCAGQLKYVSGLDGLLLAQGDAEVFKVWYYLFQNAPNHLTVEQVKAALVKTQAHYILLEPHTSITQAWLLENIPGAKLSYVDRDGSIITLHLAHER